MENLLFFYGKKKKKNIKIDGHYYNYIVFVHWAYLLLLLLFLVWNRPATTLRQACNILYNMSRCRWLWRTMPFDHHNIYATKHFHWNSSVFMAQEPLINRSYHWTIEWERNGLRIGIERNTIIIIIISSCTDFSIFSRRFELIWCEWLRERICFYWSQGYYW